MISIDEEEVEGKVLYYFPDGVRVRVITDYMENGFRFYPCEIIEGINKGAIITAREDELS